MQSNQIIINNGTLRVIGAFLLLSRRAHLLTTAKARRVLVSGGISPFAETVRSPRVAAPSEPCGSCLRAVTFRAVDCPTTALSTLHYSLDSVGIAAVTPNFFFIKRNKNLYENLIERLDKILWRSII